MSDYLENNCFWDVDLLVEARKRKEKELKKLRSSLWSRIWNWRKIKKIKQKLDELHYVT
jgi:hypothetical protein